MRIYNQIPSLKLSGDKQIQTTCIFKLTFANTTVPREMKITSIVGKVNLYFDRPIYCTHSSRPKKSHSTTSSISSLHTPIRSWIKVVELYSCEVWTILTRPWSSKAWRIKASSTSIHSSERRRTARGKGTCEDWHKQDHIQHECRAAWSINSVCQVQSQQVLRQSDVLWQLWIARSHTEVMHC